MSMKQIQKAIATEDFDGISNLREKRAKELLVLLNKKNKAEEAGDSKALEKILKAIAKHYKNNKLINEKASQMEIDWD